MFKKEKLKEKKNIKDVYVQIRIPMEEVFEELRCTKQGLTTDEASHRLDLFGPNKLEEKKVSSYFFFLKKTLIKNSCNVLIG